MLLPFRHFDDAIIYQISIALLRFIYCIRHYADKYRENLKPQKLFDYYFFTYIYLFLPSDTLFDHNTLYFSLATIPLHWHYNIHICRHQKLHWDTISFSFQFPPSSILCIKVPTVTVRLT